MDILWVFVIFSTYFFMLKIFLHKMIIKYSHRRKREEKEEMEERRRKGGKKRGKKITFTYCTLLEKFY